MAERRDYVALEWVKGEIFDTLKQARQALEAFVETPEDTTRLQFSLAYIHQVNGTLQMVEFFGAALLAEEMERLNQSMVDGDVPANQENLALLMQAILQLPNYLEKLKRGQSDLPVVILPLLNDLRAARGEPLLSETALFAPDLSAARRFIGEPDTQSIGQSSAVQLLRKLRQMYQLALLGWLRNEDAETNLEYLGKAVSRLVGLTERTPIGALWSVADGFIFALKAGRIKRSAAITVILRHLDGEMKRLLVDPVGVAEQYPHEDQLKNLLYYLAKIDATGLDRVQRIQDNYSLSQALPNEAEIESQRKRLSGPDRETVGSVVSALLEELARLKDSLDLMVRTRISETRRLSELEPGIKQMADTMAVLGMGNPRRVLNEQLELIRTTQQMPELKDDGVLMDIAGALLYVEASLSGIANDASFERDEYDDGLDDGLDGAQEAVVREARNGLEQVKDAIVEFIGSHWDHSKLESVPRELSGIRGGLVMIPLEQAAIVLTYAQEYVEDQLLGNKRTPEWHELDALADAIMGVEYYLERLARDGSGTNLDVLQRAAESISQLGYTVNLKLGADDSDDSTAGIVEVDAEADSDDLSNLSLRDVELTDHRYNESEQGAELDLDIEAIDDFETLTDWDDDVDASPAGSYAVDVEEKADTSDWQESSVNHDDVELNGEEHPVEATSKSVRQTVVADQDDLIDDDILEIFIEEAAEVLETIEENFSKYKLDPGDAVALTELRRAFHTLKGSGRMVGASVVGETAWSIENMLNCLIEGSIHHSKDLNRVIEEIADEVPALMTAFEQKQKPDTTRADYLAAIANSLAAGKVVSWGEATTESVATTDAANVDVDLELPEAIVAEEDDEDWSSYDDLPVADVEESDDFETAGFDVDNYEAGGSADTLLDIFQAELASHLDYIDLYIEETEPATALPDALQRALHTIKGSAHMASVETVAELVQPLEQLVRGMQERGRETDSDFLWLLADGAALIRAASRNVDVDSAAFQIRVQEVYNRILRVSPSQEPDDPALMSIFMSDSMDLVLGAETILNRWSNAGQPDDEVDDLIRALDKLALASQAVDLNPVADLSHGLAMLNLGGCDNVTAADDRFFSLAHDGFESLISMMDRLAAGQSIRQDSMFMERLNQVLPDSEPMQPHSVVHAKGQVDSMIRQDLEANETQEEDVPPMLAVEAPQRYSVEGDAELVDIFLEEANDILDSIQAAMEKWREDTDNTLEVEGLQRDLHTLKGGARMAEISPLGDLAHELEFLYEGLAQGRYQATPGLLELIQQCHDRLAVMVRDIESSMSCESAPDLVAAINHFLKNPGAPAHPVNMAPVKDDVIDTQSVEPPADSSSDDLPRASDAGQDDDETQETLAVQTAEPSRPMTLSPDVDLDILEIFIDEAGELLNELENAIEDWQAEPGNETHADEMKRVLHTLKGGARLARLKELGDQSHEFETFIVRAQQNKDALDETFFNNILSRQDELVQGVDAMNALLAEQGGSGAGFGPSVIQMAKELGDKNWDDQDSAPQADGADASRSTDQSHDTEGSIEQTDRVPAVKQETSTNILPFKRKEAERKKADNRRAQPQETVKVNANLLEGLVNLAGETSIARARLEQEVTDFGFTLGEMDSTIDRLREQVRRLDMETEAQILFRQERAEETNYEDFDPLEMDRYSQIQQLSRSLMESTYDLTELKGSLSDKTRDAETLLLQQSRINTELQEGLMQTRMVPFNRLVPRLRRIVRQVAGELDKQVDFAVGNAEGEVDRTVLERMISPLEHMLRNAVDHGIENADARLQSGKPVKGSIRLDLSREGGDIVLRLADDGSGMNVDRIRNKAVERGLMAADSDLNDREILQYILEAGFSTAEKVTQISGRGVGMDVVNSQVKQLGGNMAIDSRLGEGSQFTIRLPFTVSVNRALMVNIEDDNYAIPLSSIEGIVRVTPQQLAEYYRPDAPLFEYAGGRYRLEYMGGLLGTGATPNLDGLSTPVPLVLVKGNDEHHSMALHVDRLMGSREIVVKTLGPQFSTLPGVSGATILGDGSVVVILDLAALIRNSLAIEHSNMTTLPAPKVSIPASKKPARDKDSPYTVMVVDDSVTVRKVTSRLLERQGMEVILAKHGADAVAQLQDRVPDIMLLDIEMPYMDGFEVASLVRHDKRLKQMPIIMITSRTGSKHRERALSIGVNEYMGKPFQEGPLVDAIKRLLGIQA